MKKSKLCQLAEELYEGMDETEKARINLEFLYNAICCCRNLPGQMVVEMLMEMEDDQRQKLESQLQDVRKMVREWQEMACREAKLEGKFLSVDIGDILFYEVINGMSIR